MYGRFRRRNVEKLSLEFDNGYDERPALKYYDYRALVCSTVKHALLSQTYIIEQTSNLNDQCNISSALLVQPSSHRAIFALTQTDISGLTTD